MKILAWRPIASDHAAGPSFKLSDEDIENLDVQLDQPDDPELSGLRPVGWFASHSRSGLELRPSDIELHESLFPQDWQVVFLIQTSKDALAKGAFFLRDQNGDLPPAPAADPFEIRANPMRLASKRFAAPKPKRDPEASPSRWVTRSPAHAVPPAPLAPPRPVTVPSAAPQSPAPQPPAPAAKVPAPRPPEPPVPAFAAAAPPRRDFKLRRLFWIGAFCVLGGGAVIAVPRLLPAEKAALALQATDFQGATAQQIHLKWELNSPAFRSAARATLEVIDGKNTKIIELDADEIQRGSLTYVRQSGDVQVRMTVHRRNGNPVQELTRYLGPAVDSEAETAVPEKSESERIASETEKLRRVLREEQARTKRLEESIATIKSRLEQEPVRNP